jgi:hypothetical protein
MTRIRNRSGEHKEVRSSLTNSITELSPSVGQWTGCSSGGKTCRAIDHGGEGLTMKILFLHGWTSVPGGIKPTFLKDHGHTVFNPKLPDEDFEKAVRIAQEDFNRHQPDVVVGSSRGGAIAMNINSGGARLVLLCPAWKKWGTAKTVKPGTVILHSKNDEVIPFADSEELVRNSGLLPSALIEVGSDHRLADPEPLAAMLRACETISSGD